MPCSPDGLRADVPGEPPAGLGAAHIGEYTVSTHTGADFTHAELQDDFAVVYFGTTTDRECVTELEKLAEVVQQSGACLLASLHFCCLLHTASSSTC